MGNSQNNIITFPVEAIEHPARTASMNSDDVPSAVAEIKDVYYFMKTKKAEEIMGIVLPLVTQGFLAYGMNLSDRKNAKNVGLMIEAIRAAIYGYFELPHPLHMIGKSLFAEVDGKIVLKQMHIESIPISNT